MTAMKKTIIIAFMLLVTVFITNACAAQPFRLHIVANSNTKEDQQVKLAVRDAVLQATKQEIVKCKNAKQAKEYISDNIEIIVKTANDILEENDFDYTASAAVGNYHFPDKRYNDVLYPEGDYQALRLILGQGEGENWWCVMFPPLCISEIEEENADVEYTSFFAELIEKLFGENKLTVK